MQTKIAEITVFPSFGLAEVPNVSYGLGVKRKQRVKAGQTEAEAYIGLALDTPRSAVLALLTKSTDTAKHEEEIDSLIAASANALFQTATESALKAEKENKLGEGKTVLDYIIKFVQEYGNRGPAKAKTELELVFAAIAALDKDCFGEVRREQGIWLKANSGKTTADWRASQVCVDLKTKLAGSPEGYAAKLQTYTALISRRDSLQGVSDLV